MAKYVLIFHVMILSLIIYHECKTFNVGLLFPWNGFYAFGSHSAGAITVALENIKLDRQTFSAINDARHVFNITWADTKCDPQYGLPLLVKMLCGRGLFPKVDVFIGPACSFVCEPGGYIAAGFNIPMVSPSCFSSILSNKAKFPTFARATGTASLQAPVYLESLNYFGFKRVSIFTGSENVWNTAAADIRAFLEEGGIEVTDYLNLQRIDIMSTLGVLKIFCRGELRIKYQHFFGQIIAVQSQ